MMKESVLIKIFTGPSIGIRIDHVVERDPFELAAIGATTTSNPVSSTTRSSRCRKVYTKSSYLKTHQSIRTGIIRYCTQKAQFGYFE